MIHEFKISSSVDLAAEEEAEVGLGVGRKIFNEQLREYYFQSGNIHPLYIRHAVLHITINSHIY